MLPLTLHKKIDFNWHTTSVLTVSAKPFKLLKFSTLSCRDDKVDNTYLGLNEDLTGNIFTRKPVRYFTHNFLYISNIQSHCLYAPCSAYGNSKSVFWFVQGMHVVFSMIFCVYITCLTIFIEKTRSLLNHGKKRSILLVNPSFQWDLTSIRRYKNIIHWS